MHTKIKLTRAKLSDKRVDRNIIVTDDDPIINAEGEDYLVAEIETGINHTPRKTHARNQSRTQMCIP